MLLRLLYFGVNFLDVYKRQVSIHPAFSADPVIIDSVQITKSVNSEPAAKKSSDTMGMKHRIGFGLYTTYGSINCQLAEKTGFTDADAEVMKEALRTLFENDVSSARRCV